MTQTIKLTLPCLPSRALSPNAHIHWREKYDAAKMLMWEMVAAMSQQSIWTLADRHASTRLETRGFPWEKVKVKLTFYVPDSRRRDVANYTQMSQPIFNALQGRVIKDDKDIISIEAEFIKDKTRSPMTVMVISQVAEGE